MEKSRDYQIEYSTCASLIMKSHVTAYTSIDQHILWCTLKDMGVAEHLIVALRNLYTNQESTVRREYGETSNFPIGIGVRQGPSKSTETTLVCSTTDTYRCKTVYTPSYIYR